jgi:hypothetical protein
VSPASSTFAACTVLLTASPAPASAILEVVALWLSVAVTAWFCVSWPVVLMNTSLSFVATPVMVDVDIVSIVRLPVFVSENDPVPLPPRYRSASTEVMLLVELFNDTGPTVFNTSPPPVMGCDCPMPEDELSDSR